MIKRLEQVAALVVAAGLALVSYWLFFSWAQGGGAHRRQRPGPSSAAPALVTPRSPAVSETSTGLEQPLLGGVVLQTGDMLPHLLGGDSQPQRIADLHDATQGSRWILQSLAEKGLREV
jgi:hypothetical protein